MVHQMKTGQAAKAIEEILSICKLSERLVNPALTLLNKVSAG